MTEQELPFTRKTRTVLAHAQREAGRLLHAAVDPEHLLLGILRHGDCFAANLIRQRAPDIEALTREVQQILPPGSLENVVLDIPFSQRTEQFLLQVETTRRRLNHDEIRTDHILLALTNEPESPLAALLGRHGITAKTVLEAILAEYGVVQQATPSEIFLLQALVKEGGMTTMAIQALLSRKEGESVKRALLASGFVNEAEIVRLLAKESGLQSIDLSSLEPDATLVKQFPTELARRLRVFPVRFDTGEDTLFVALADPLDKDKLEEIQALWGVNVVPLLGSETLLHQLIEQYFPLT